MAVYPVLDKIDDPQDLRSLDMAQLRTLAWELRHFVQGNTREKVAHIKSSLGVTELTIALHYAFNTPEDILVWDVGHQAYVHKVLTGRKARFSTNRRLDGISGFTRRAESVYDPFGAGHSSTSVSAAIGFALSARLNNINRRHIAVIGDGALTGGESFEALNYLGQENLDVIVVLNDNESSIDTNVGALARYGTYAGLCEAFNIAYAGEVDGHNVEELTQIFFSLRKNPGPQFVRVKTAKGRGWDTPEGVTVDKSLTFQDFFSGTLIEIAKQNPKVVAVTPAMLSGSGLDKFREHFPGRTFDVGIAEQHAVTMAAALSAEGFIPVCHLYSTFAQRAYDQIIHDVALQNLPVVFCLDRAGIVGEDGPTHHGSFDVSFLQAIPNLVISAPMDAVSLEALLKQAVEARSPFVIRYPKSETPVSPDGLELQIGKMRLLKKGRKKAVISYGAIGQEVVKALVDLPYSHYDLVYLKPIDRETIYDILQHYDEVITVEENSRAGGLAETLAFIKSEWRNNIPLKARFLPDVFIEHGTRDELLQKYGLDYRSLRTFFTEAL